MDYYLLKDGNRTGPYKVFQIVEMLRSRQVDESDLAWCSEVDGWTPLKEMPPLEGLIEGVEEEIDRSVAAEVVRRSKDDAKTGSQAWMRFVARIVDTWLAYQVVALIAVAAGLFTAEVVYLKSDLLIHTALAVFSSYGWVFAEAWMIARWGTTPGKFMLNLRVVTDSGEILTFAQSMRRSMSVWVRGFGMGIPLVQILTYVASYFYLRQDGVTPWDGQQSLHIDQQPMGPARWLAVVAAGAVMFAVMAVTAYYFDPEWREQFQNNVRDLQDLLRKGSGSQPVT